MTILLIAAALMAGPQDTEIEIVETGPAPHSRVMMMRIAETREETASQAAALFDARDKDKNGFLEGAELAMAHGGLAMMDMPGHPIPPGHPMPPMPHREAMDPAKMFDKIDTDGNGAISREEFAAHHKDHAMPAMPRMMIRTMEGHAPHAEGKDVVVHRKVEREGDKETHEVIVERVGEAPKDGEKVQVFVRRMGEGGEWTGAEGKTVMLERMKTWMDTKEDADGDGRVSRQEAIDRALSHFDAMDSNGNGTLDEGEGPAMIRRIVEHAH